MASKFLQLLTLELEINQWVPTLILQQIGRRPIITPHHVQLYTSNYETVKTSFINLCNHKWCALSSRSFPDCPSSVSQPASQSAQQPGGGAAFISHARLAPKSIRNSCFLRWIASADRKTFTGYVETVGRKQFSTHWHLTLAWLKLITLALA